MSYKCLKITSTLLIDSAVNNLYHYAVMLDRLPNFIDPVAFAERQKQLKGEIALSHFTRLDVVLSDDIGKVNIDLSFAKEGRLSVIRGKIEANLNLECQSCLKTVNYSLVLDVKLAVVQSLEHVDKLAGEYDPLMLNEEKMSLSKIIEDELLLALPDFPRHEKPCAEVQKDMAQNPEYDKRKQSNNPFSILAQLKNTGDK